MYHNDNIEGCKGCPRAQGRGDTPEISPQRNIENSQFRQFDWVSGERWRNRTHPFHRSFRPTHLCYRVRLPAIANGSGDTVALCPTLYSRSSKNRRGPGTYCLLVIDRTYRRDSTRPARPHPFLLETSLEMWYSVNPTPA